MTIGTHPHLVSFLKTFHYSVNIGFARIGPEITGPITTEGEKELQRAAELSDLCKVTLSLAPTIILFTTFCLEAWHLGEKLNVPTIGVSFFPLDTGRGQVSGHRDPLEGLRQEIFENIPNLFSALDEDSPSKVSWRDIELWMSSLFSDRHGTLRDNLGLPPLVFLNHTGQVCLPKKTTMLLAYGSSVIESVRPTQPESDAYIHCGFWPCFQLDNEALKDAIEPLQDNPEDSKEHEKISNRQQEDRNMFEYIDNCRSANKGLVYIGFGSMDYLDPRLSSTDFITHLLGSLNEALVQMNSSGIWLVSTQNKSIPKIYSEYCQTEGKAGRDVHIFMYNGSFPHELLVLTMQYGTATVVDCYRKTNFQESQYEGSFCNAMRVCGIDEKHPSFRPVLAIHHGGAGTVSRFIQLATVQIVVPFLFDQITWARSLQALKLAPEPFLADAFENNIANRYPLSVTIGLWKMRFMRAKILSESRDIYSFARDLYFDNIAGLHKAAKFVSNMMTAASRLQ